jgi:tetraacyldisaccharide 4'-kinase
MDSGFWLREWEQAIDPENLSFFGQIEKALLKSVSFFYGAAVVVRNILYDAGFKTVCRVKVPVISIGNLSMGGSGKTTLAIWCAKKIIEKGKKVAVLSRGYKRKGNERELRVVCDGEKIFEEVSVSGDEPRLIAEELRTAVVIVGADRAQSAQVAVQKFKADAIILDDGFQHRKFHRDFNVLLLDDSLLRAPHLVPRGVLRERVASIKRADFVVVKTERDNFVELFEKQYSVSIRKPAAQFSYRLDRLKERVSGKIISIAELKEKKVFACSAIAHPRHFEEFLEKEGAVIVGRKRFPDHHYFGAEELKEIQTEAETLAAVVVVTDKDAVKIPLDFNCWVAQVSINWFGGEEDFFNALLRNVS